jgi:HD-like signal output (HDOD) protein/ActR/RegA family two-component response regulator
MPFDTQTGNDLPSIVFVDDEMNILSALRRMLWHMRNEWDMRFANGPQEALRELCERPADVVVSDMRMPGMNGAELLSVIRERYPETIRIILSGHSESEAILRSIGPSHRFISKPCDGATLIETVNQSIRLRKDIVNPDILRFTLSDKSIASPPHVILDLLDKLESAHSTIDEIADLISSDLALASSVLRMVNSGFFNLPDQIVSVNSAVRLLGIDTIKSIAIVGGVFNSYEGPSTIAEQIEVLSRRSFRIGCKAKVIAAACGLQENDAQLACTAGILSHIGTLLMLVKRTVSFKEMTRNLDVSKKPLEAAEKEHFGFSHAHLGAHLLAGWGFNEEILQSVVYHHMPSQSGSAKMSALACVHIAQAMYPLEKVRDVNVTIEDFDLETEWLCQIGADRVFPEILEEVRRVSKLWK